MRRILGYGLISLGSLCLLVSAERCGPAAPRTPESSQAAAGQTAVPPADLQALRGQLDEVVTAYRKIIVVMSDLDSLPASDRSLAVLVARLVFEQDRERLASLDEALRGELEAFAASGFPATPPHLGALLGALESSPGWHDADKLAFRDEVVMLTDRVREMAPTSAAGKALAVRLGEDTEALDRIQGLYDRELDAIFAKLATRGMPVRREAWDAYLAFLRTSIRARDVVNELRREVQPALRPAGAPAPHELDGSSLPDKTLVLSFDDGPHPRYTQEILDVLARFKVKSLFFEVGQNLGRLDRAGAVRETRAAPESQRVLAGGNLVGNHTYSHAYLPKLATSKVDEELDLTNRMIETVDAKQPALFRPPYGALSDAVRAEVRSRRLRAILWNIDSQDWADPVPKSVANRVIAEARKAGRGVILFHDIHDRAAVALPLVIETLQAEGFHFALWDGERVLDPGPPPPTPTPTPEPPPLSLYRESFAVIVGIDDYQKWPKLSYATADARAMRDLLTSRYGFKPENITLLLDRDATRERILSVLGDALASPQRVQRDDRVLVFFAGHGATRQLASGRSLGYIVPVDGDTANLQGSCISMSNFQDIDDALPAKHVLYLMDACYGGLALLRGGPAGQPDPRKYLAEITRRTARQMLTAGGPDEQVADNGPGGHSIFTWTLLQGLEGKADLNGDGVITASELFAYVGPLVSSVSKQTPAFGNLLGSEGGEFVFQCAHEDEFLSALSQQLDDQGVRLSTQLDEVRARIAAKRERNQALQKELVTAERELKRLGGTGVAESPAEQARRASDRGLALYREKRYQEALEAFETAFRLQPSNAQLANNIGFVNFRLGKPEVALAWYERTLALDPARAVAWANSGEAYEKLGRPEDAIRAYQRFLELAPNHPGAAGARERLAALGGEATPPAR